MADKLSVNSTSRPPDNSSRPTQAEQVKSLLYSERLKTNVTWDNRLKRNILEITLDKVDDMLYDD